MPEWYELVIDVIDTRSFSNLWYWIALAVIWSTASHWVLGVPHDLVTRARRQRGLVEQDLHDLVRVNVNRLLYIADKAGVWMLGLSCFGLTMLFILGFGYGLELAQAVFFLALPSSLVFALSVRTARKIHAADGEGLYHTMYVHRFQTQILGLVSIFVTAFWGMWKNLSMGFF